MEKYEERDKRTETKVEKIGKQVDTLGDTLTEEFTSFLVPLLESNIGAKQAAMEKRIKSLEENLESSISQEDFVENKPQGSLIHPPQHLDVKESAQATEEHQKYFLRNKPQVLMETKNLTPDSQEISQGEEVSVLTKDCFAVTTLEASPPHDISHIGEEGSTPHVACNTITTFKGVQPLQELEEGEIYEEEDEPFEGTQLQDQPRCLTLLNNRWKEMKEIYDQALHYPQPFNTLHKVESLGRFLITCSINGVTFEDALCDSGSCINIMSTDAARKIGLRHLQPSDIRIGLANSSFTIPDGMVRDIHVRVGICNVPTDFQVINAEKGRFTPLILGGAFLATAGAVMDWPNRRMTLTNVNGDIFYEAKPFNPPTRRCREEDYAREPPDAFDGGRSKRACLRTTHSPNHA
ncbi:PREDICTED: uncharacterized protein LOC104748696 [Camelina sativa]|uniref:Uncharacterized protein LOC104748696 n=1 Tax=Camelina sativa TaxID=90675 RepID=A0ABM0WBG6_CAMSA|nr:PREDICTED: uncharacterized protein LOC104748696 [Camelina sativa]